jgi:hypothetical protein
MNPPQARAVVDLRCGSRYQVPPGSAGVFESVFTIDAVHVCVDLRCLRVSRNLEKNLSEAPQAPKFFEICHSPLHLPPKHTQYTCTG